MIQFEERYQNERGIVLDRWTEMNYIQVVNSVDAMYQPFLKQYILTWLHFVKQYWQDTDPATNYTVWDVYTLRETVFYPSMQQSLSFSAAALENDFEGIREVERKMRLVDASMVDRLQVHYKKHEYAELPPSSKTDLTPHVSTDDWKPHYNTATLSGKDLVMVGPLVLSWTVWDGSTHYEVHMEDGRLVHKLEPVSNGLLRRFKDPIKRHEAAIKRVQKLLSLTDWSLIEQLSNKQQRYLHVLLVEECKEKLL